jgi:hypothetical protein
MKATFRPHAGADVESVRDTEPNSRLDKLIVLIGIVSFLMAYTISEILTRMAAVEIVSNRA